MRLKSVIIDGFKSYAHRQALEDLDPHFNAITGLNGSGKSNIFDALCFVMGISNLKRVRVEETRDLIYKSGNAGIQTATVTIEFLNNDKVTAPPEYPPEEFPIIRISRSVAVGGRQKFYLNDRTSDSSKVKQFFQNALLNVDNPHFMVLQGTVHKMISMRSAEILGLLEEASGTRVFDTRRRAAENLLRSKEKRVTAINQAIDEITPRVNAMRQQKEEYGNFLRAREGFAEKSKFSIGYQCWKLQQITTRKHDKINDIQSNLDDRKRLMVDIPSLKSSCQRLISLLEEQIREPLQMLENLREQKSETLKEQAKTKTLLGTAEKAIKSMEKELKRIQEEQSTVNKNLENFDKSTANMLQKYEEMGLLRKEAEENIQKLKESIRLLKSGVQASFNGVSAHEEWENIKRKLITISGEKRRLRDRLEVYKKDEKRYLEKISRNRETSSGLRKELEQAANAFKEMEIKYQPYKDDFNLVPELRRKIQTMGEEFHKKTAEVLSTNSVCAPLQYAPIKGIDVESQIFGRVGELLTPHDSQYTKALTAGTGFAVLDRVVVTTDDVAQLLIDKGNLRSRTSFLPLNCVSQNPHVIDEKRFKCAQVIASQYEEGFVVLASMLVTYDDMFAIIAHNTYGTFVVCSDLVLAQKLAGDPSTKIKAVTIGGDVADPQGIVSGGSANNLCDFVAEFSAASARKSPLKKIREELAVAEGALLRVEQRCKEGHAYYQAYLKAEVAYQDLNQEVKGTWDGADGGMGESPETTLVEIQKNMKDVEVSLRKLEEKEQSCHQQSEKIKEMLAEDPAKVEKQLLTKLKEEEIKEIKMKRQMTEDEGKNDRMQGEKSIFEQRVLDIEAEVDVKEKDITEKRKEEGDLKTALADIQHNYKRLMELLKEEESKSNSLNKDLIEQREELRRLEQQEEQCHKGMKDDEAAIKILKREVDHELSKMNQILKDHPWLRKEQEQLGNTEGPFYYEDEERSANTLKEVEEMRVILTQSERTMNEKASIMYEEYKRGIDQLALQRSTLVYDRELILKTIASVEGKKWKTLDIMFNMVSGIFGKLFSVCLPGASSKLVEKRDPETKRLVGLAVCVSFNGHDKESLTELSGGQRSLLALCLILALLRVRPAPFYILDEMDAALDPSHTQNIGQMLQTHFPSGQFLLVSLKDGMYNNANVLYEIANTLGYSQITRRASGGKKNAGEKHNRL